MNLLKNEERIELLKNLLSDPDDWISREILRLSDEEYPSGCGRLALTSVSAIAAWQVAR